MLRPAERAHLVCPVCGVRLGTVRARRHVVAPVFEEGATRISYLFFCSGACVREFSQTGDSRVTPGWILQHPIQSPDGRRN